MSQPLNHQTANKKAFQSVLMHAGFFADFCQPIFDRLGVNNFSYSSLSSRGQFITLNSNPIFLENLDALGICEKIPNAILTAHTKPGFYLLDGDEKAKARFTDYVEICGAYNYGHTLRFVKVEHTNNDIIIKRYGFEAPLINNNINNTYLNQVDVIKDFFDYFDSRFTHLIDRLPSMKVKIVPSMFNQYHAPPQQPPPLGVAAECEKDFIEHCLLRGIESKKITHQEKEVIKWYIKGKSAEETGIIMGLSKRTVERYFEILRRKFNCHKKQEIVNHLLGPDFCILK